jgi:hypothetical protein
MICYHFHKSFPSNAFNQKAARLWQNLRISQETEIISDDADSQACVLRKFETTIWTTLTKDFKL